MIRYSTYTNAAAMAEPRKPWISPSDMKGTRMNQFVAPTSFITETSRRRAKMAMRMELRMRTAADTISTTAMPRQTHFETLITFSSVWICWVGAVTVSTPGAPFSVLMTWLASASTTGVHQYEVGIADSLVLSI